MTKKEKFIALFFEVNKKTIGILAILFLIANCILQCQFFHLFTDPFGHGDEKGYIYLIDKFHEFDLDTFSNSTAQPFAFVGFLFNKLFNDARFTVRVVSLLSSVITVGFLYYYYKRYKFSLLFTQSKVLNNLIIFNTLFAVYYIFEQHFIGTSDVFSVAFGLPAFLLLTEVLLNNRKHSVILIGLLFALSFTTRPTFIIILLAFLITLAVFFPKKLISQKLISVGCFFVLFTAIINYNPLINDGKIVMDVKEIPKETGTSWFEMNYLMAKKWDAGEIPRTQWLSHIDVIKFKKENPDFVFPKNHIDIMINDPGVFFRQMLRMFAISMYSSFRYLYFLFPFLILYFFIKSGKENKIETKKVYFTVVFYFVGLLIFMVTAIKMMEFRWMQILVVYFAFYALHFTKDISQKSRILLFNLIFLSGLGFFILKMLK